MPRLVHAQCEDMPHVVGVVHMTCEKPSLATGSVVQSTVVGQVGVDGPRAANPVELALNNVLEPAVTRGHITEDDIVLGQAGEIICATHNRALFMADGLTGLYQHLAT